jgi:hypothetical protein
MKTIIKRRRFCECGCRQIVKNRVVNGHKTKDFGKRVAEANAKRVWTDESREKLKASSKGKNKGRIPYNKGKTGLYHCTEETKKKIGIAQIGRVYTEERNKKISNAKIGKPKSEEHKEKIRKTLQGNIPWNKDLKNCFSEETVRAIREACTLLWQDPVYCNKQMTSRHICPNKQETKLLALLNRLLLGEYKYTGDFSFIIMGRKK